jgi:thioredoxin reductase (NADPH)
MSRYLIDRIEADARITVRPDTQVVGLIGVDRLEGVRIRRDGHPDAAEMAVCGLFVFIGARPGTGWLAGQLAQDIDGFLLTGNDIPPSRREDGSRAPLFLETSRPGIFAVGDVRSGSVKRAAAAIGEGATAVRVVFDRLQAAGTVDTVGSGAGRPRGARG